MGKQATKKRPKAEPKELVFVPANANTFLSKDQIAVLLSIGKKWIDRKIASGGFPKPDAHLGPLPRWRTDTFNAWFDKQCGRIDKEE